LGPTMNKSSFILTLLLTSLFPMFAFSSIAPFFPSRKVILGRDSFLVIEHQYRGKDHVRVYNNKGKLFQKMENMKSGRAFFDWIENIESDLSGYPPLWSFTNNVSGIYLYAYYAVFDSGNVVVTLASFEQSMESYPSVVGIEFRNTTGVIKRYSCKDLCPNPANLEFFWLGPIGKSRFWFFESDDQHERYFSLTTTDWYSYLFKIENGEMIRKTFLFSNIKFKFLLWFPLVLVCLTLTLLIKFSIRKIVFNKYIPIVLLALVHLSLSIALSPNFSVHGFHLDDLFHDPKTFSFNILSWPLVFHLRNWPPFYRFLQMSLGFIPFLVNSLIWGLMIYLLVKRFFKQNPNLALHRTPTAGAGEL
jgi:hypothetical protein